MATITSMHMITPEENKQGIKEKRKLRLHMKSQRSLTIKETHDIKKKNLEYSFLH